MNAAYTGNRISALRKEKNLTQEQLAEEIGSTNKTVSRWETGVYIPPAEMLLTLSQYYNVTVNEILNGQRLADSEFKAAAEKNVVDTLKESKYEAKYKEVQAAKHWFKRHSVELIMEFVMIIALSTISLIPKLERFAVAFILFFALVVWIVISFLRLKTYISKQVYGKPSNKKTIQRHDDE